MVEARDIRNHPGLVLRRRSESIELYLDAGGVWLTDAVPPHVLSEALE